MFAICFVDFDQTDLLLFISAKAVIDDNVGQYLDAMPMQCANTG